MDHLALEARHDEIKKFCQKWKIAELSIFGSALRDDFNPQTSDIDILYVFSEGVSWGWEIAQIKDELEEIFQRSVELVSKRAIESSRNPYRKNAILLDHKVIYEEPE